MKKISKKFKNEFGRDIEIIVSENKEDKDKQTKISIAGPDSNSEWIITRRETEILYELLNEALK